MKVSPLPSEIEVPDAPRTLNILPLSDLHLPMNLEASRRILNNRSYLNRMNHAVLLGDMVASYGTPREYSQVAKFVRQLRVPYSAINGNHEFYFHYDEREIERGNYVWDEPSLAEKTRNLEKFRNFFGLENLYRAQHTPRGSFIFLGLDDIDSTKQETLSAAQWNFLNEALQQQPNLPAFVFCHAPLMLETRLDLIYYDAARTACVEADASTRAALSSRLAPTFWMSGHIHLRPDHYLFAPYEIARDVWQIHCPDSWGYSRWQREQHAPQRHSGTFSRHLEIGENAVTFVAHDHVKRQDIARQTVEWKLENARVLAGACGA